MHIYDLDQKTLTTSPRELSPRKRNSLGIHSGLTRYKNHVENHQFYLKWRNMELKLR